MRFDDIITLHGPLGFDELKKELSRDMRSGGICSSRIVGLMPETFIHRYSKYISNGYAFPESITTAVLEWNNEKFDFISKYYNLIIPKAILEICEYKKLLVDMLNTLSPISPRTPSNDIIEGFKSRLSELKFFNYKKLCEICGTYLQSHDDTTQNFNFSKLINRDVNLKSRFTKYLNGSMSLYNLIHDEIAPQAKFMEKFCINLSKFSIEQFCIFIIAYDLKPIKRK